MTNPTHLRAQLVALSAALFASFGVAAHAAPTSPTPPKPKITAKQAEAAAVKKIPGTAKSSKYEFEDGHWQYAVIVTTKAGQMYEVEVNSTTGKVTDTEKTSATEEAKEEAADKKKAATKSTKPAKEDKDDEKDEKSEKAGK